MKPLLNAYLLGWVVAMTSGCSRDVLVGNMNGQICSEVGANMSPDDGCNTCNCDASHHWTCTERDCQCQPGSKKPAEDGCNSCSCNAEGSWQCTLMYCGSGATGGGGAGTGANSSTSTTEGPGGSGFGSAPSGGSGAYGNTDSGGSGAYGNTDSGGSGAYGNTNSGGSTESGGSTGTICCMAMAICKDGDITLANNEPCPANSSCYTSSICCSTVRCATPTLVQCTAMAVCDAGDAQISGTCPPNYTCYSREVCGTHVDCLRQTTSCTPGDIIVPSNTCSGCKCNNGGKWDCTTSTCSADVCANGQSRYQNFRAQMLTKYGSSGCTTNSDCQLVYEINHCVANCGTALPAVMANTFESNLATIANDYCASCPTPAVPPCYPSVATCVAGVCVNGSFAAN